MNALKRLITHFIILCFYITSFHPQASMSFAADADNEETKTETTFTPSKDPSLAHLDYTNSEQKIGKQSKAQMMTILAMLLGPSIAMACFQPISSKIFAASGAAYLLMEVMNYSKYKKASTSNQEMYAELDPETYDLQIEAFTYAEQQELTAASALKKKASALNIFSLGMTAAAIMAIVEGVRALVPSQQGTDVCTGSVSKIDFNKVFDLFFSSAMAKESEKVSGAFSSMGILSAAAGAILAYKGVAKATIQPALRNGFVRAAVFGVFAGLAMMAKSEVNKAKSKAEANANIYRNLREQLERALNGAQRFAGINGVGNSIRNTLPRYQGIRDDLENPSAGAICLVGKLGEQRVDEQCLCAKNKTCTKTDFSSVSLGSNGLPGSYGDVLSGLSSGANSLFAGKTAAANSSFNSLSSNAKSLRDLLNKKKKLADSIFKKNKEKMRMNKLEADMEKHFGDDLKGALENLKGNERLLASTLSNPIQSSSSISSQALASAQNGDTKELLESIQTNALPLKNNGLAADDASQFKFNFDQATNDSMAQEKTDEEIIADMKEYNPTGNDISQRPDDSIFKIITMRYFRTAYPRIFD